ncbi:Ufm1-specific protease 1 [Armadillidium vulgare]|nr:Ufm1-specific protease 1 [Armadillidium vulgare]
MGGGRDYVCDLLPNVHEGLPVPHGVEEIEYVKGDYLYYHYGCDGFDDRGWGCGYRTLMTLCSWVRGQLSSARGTVSSLAAVPSNRDVQDILVRIGDKEGDFKGSNQWIGCVEATLVIDTLYGIPSKVIHVTKGDDLHQHTQVLFDHFKARGAPVMMGGDNDNSSKGIVGICRGKEEENSYLLVVDPHFWGEAREQSYLQSNNWVKWQKLSDFDSSSFYNLCLPQLTVLSTFTTTNDLLPQEQT